MAYTLSLLWFCLCLCSAAALSSQVKEHTLTTGSGGGYEDQPPPDDPGLPRGFFVYGEDITAAFYTLLDITRTIIHLTDRFWEMLLCTWRFVSRCMEVVFFLTLPSSSQYCTRLREGTIFYVIPPTGPVFPIRLTELSVERIYEQIAYSTGIPTTAFKLFKNSKEVRHFCQIANGGSVEITIPLLGGTRKRKRTDDVTPSTRHKQLNRPHFGRCSVRQKQLNRPHFGRCSVRQKQLNRPHFGRCSVRQKQLNRPHFGRCSVRQKQLNRPHFGRCSVRQKQLNRPHFGRCSVRLQPLPRSPSISPVQSYTSNPLNDVFDFNEPDTPYSPVILSPRKQAQDLDADDMSISSQSTHSDSEANEDFASSDMESTDSENLDSSYFAEPQVRPKTSRRCKDSEVKSRSKLLLRAIHPTTLRKVAALERCCKKNCASRFSRSTMKAKRTDYFCAESRKRWIKEKLGSFQVGREKVYFEFKVDGIVLCREAWCRVYGINKNAYYRELKDFKLGLEWDGLRRGRSLSIQCVSASVWFGYYVASHGDKMPHKNEIWLPYNTRKVDIYNKYAEECEERSQKFCCEESFRNMWKYFYPHVSIKTCSLFTKCTICVRLGRNLAKTRDPVKRREIKLKRQEHDARQMAERLAYYQRREAARKEPEKYLSLIVDDMLVHMNIFCERCHDDGVFPFIFAPQVAIATSRRGFCPIHKASRFSL
uniref:Ubiquitin-like domain-containing protein n=1 Tax=Branchiostoma floridae TaxID=7739 RepID=C3Y7B4_BRAFL|eukprot:XP_002607732.1 hypothetical protein BRAFLDRAFT_82821 [Branchiostoma floridae]